MLVFENPYKVNNNDLIKYQLKITDLNTNDLFKNAYKASDLRLFFSGLFLSHSRSQGSSQQM
jgi:hypothetical protein